jgi:heme/copper-type cytochrome/quinol oxidase subunit 2
MKLFLIIALGILLLMEGISFFVYQSRTQTPAEEKPPTTQTVEPKKEEEPAASSDQKAEQNTSDDFPAPTVEIKDGVAERTIHMGVRQWAWDPALLTVKQGEVVHLIIHNADVRHTLVIPELGIDANIPEDGAIVTFTATRKGTFDFLCGTYCGVGHAEMHGRLVIE